VKQLVVRVRNNLAQFYQQVKFNLTAFADLLLRHAAQFFRDLLQKEKEIGTDLIKIKKHLFLDLPRQWRKIVHVWYVILKQGWDIAKDIILNFRQYVHDTYQWLWQKTTDYAKQKWLGLKPKVDNLTHTTIAIGTATNTLRITIQIIPIILSVLTVLATAPLINAILPAFIFETYVIFSILFLISAYVGYSKYNELVTRAKLDRETQENTLETAALKLETFSLKQELAKALERIKDLEAEVGIVDSDSALTPALNRTRTRRSVPDLTSEVMYDAPARDLRHTQ
jgi:hypothetical protein